VSPVLLSLAFASSSHENVSRVEDLSENISVFWHLVVSITSLQNFEQDSVLVHSCTLSSCVPIKVFIPLSNPLNSLSSDSNAAYSSSIAADTLAEVVSIIGVVSLGAGIRSNAGLGSLLTGVDPFDNVGVGSLLILLKGGVGSLLGAENDEVVINAGLGSDVAFGRVIDFEDGGGFIGVDWAKLELPESENMSDRLAAGLVTELIG